MDGATSWLFRAMLEPKPTVGHLCMAAYGEASLENSSTTRGSSSTMARVYDPVKNTYMPGRQQPLDAEGR